MRHAFVLCLLLVPAGVLPAEEVSDLPGRVVRQRRALLGARAELKALELEEKLTASGGREEGPRVELADALPKFRRVRDLLAKTHRRRMEALDDLARDLRRNREAAEKAWEPVARETLEVRVACARLEAARAARPARPLIDGPFLLVLVYGGFVAVVGTLLVLHERRGDVRRWWRAGGASALVGLVLVSPLRAAGEPGPLLAELEKLRADEQDLAAAADRARARIALLRQERPDAWTRLFGPPPGDDGTLRAWDDEAALRLRAALTEELTARALLDDADAQLAEAARLRERESSAALQETLAGLGRTAFRILACVLLAGAPFVALVRARGRQRNARAVAARTCPRCLRRDTLGARPGPKDDPPAGPRVVCCSGCRFVFPARDRGRPRLSFAVVGPRGSGKTRWLGTLYSELMNGPAGTALRAVPTSAERVQFSDVLRRVAEGADTGPTVHDVLPPAPVTLYLEDSDPLGRRPALLDLFDFAGEMTSRQTDADPPRRRALLADGFLFFLDPTRVSGGMLEQQRDALRRFHDDLRLARDLDVGARVRVPAAVCVSKLDLLDQNPYAGLLGDGRPDRLPGASDAQLSLSTIRERSRACQEALAVLFQGWDVAREFRERYRDVLFFPVSSARPGVGEPLLWLLHTHGYCVLPDS